jgi:tight adherence protein B
MRRRGTRSKLDIALEAAGIALTPGEYVVAVAAGAIVGLAIGILTGSLLAGLVLMSLIVILPRIVLGMAGERRRNAFADQLEGTLLLISSSMRAGYGLNQAMSAVATEAATPTSEEFTRVVAETRVGRDLDQSLRGVAERMRNDDFAWVADAIEIQSRVGGNLAEILDTVGNTLRERSQIRRQIHALSAEGRMSAVILIALPFGLAGIISVVNPGYLDPLVQTLTGRIMLGVGVFLMIMGTIWIRRIVRLVF